MIGRVLALGAAGFLQLVRSRVYLNLLVAGVALVLAALAFDRLSAGEGGRVLVDVGLAFVSLLSALLGGVVAITTVTREIESKQIHLLVARPMRRGEIVAGRFTTAALLVVVTNALLGLLLWGLLSGLGFDRGAASFAAALYASFEGFIVAAIAIFFGVGSSSTTSATFTATLFVLGRLTLSLRELLDAGKFSAPLSSLLEGVYAVLPHSFVFDLTTWARASEPVAAAMLLQGAVYGVCYCGAFLCFATLRLGRRDLL